MTTGARVYELAVALMDEQSAAGAYDTADNADFKNRALPLIAVLGNECSMACEGLPREPFAPPDSLGDAIDLPDGLCLTALPYGLAYLLTLESAPEASAQFQRRYRDSIELYRLSSGAVLGEIEDVYA